MSSTTQSQSQPIVVVGGGLAGSMCALLLSKHDNTNVIVIESRPDFRATDIITDSNNRLTDSLKRSINLALSYRGICALKRSGIYDSIEHNLIPMQARVVHKLDGGISVQPYGTGDQAINSISRSDLNKLLLDQLDKQNNVKLLFNTKVNSIDSNGVLTYTDNSTNKQDKIESLFIVGADGAYSTVRQSLMKLCRTSFSIDYIQHGYKELTIPPTQDNQYALSNPNGLHIWPRHEFMLIALPNPNKSFTCTLFAPFDGSEGLDSIRTDNDIMNYFNKYFKDVIPLMPDLLHDYKTSPNSPLVTVKTTPWVYKDKIVLIGDAAHACVPFYGQGMNAAFEDALLLDEIYTQYNGQSTHTLNEFNKQRVDAGHALAELSLENYVEMRSKTASPLFVLKKRIESILHYIMPSIWVPQYTMVAFTRTPYDIALKKARKQDKILNIALATSAVSLVVTATTLAIKYIPQIQTFKNQLFTDRQHKRFIAADFRTKI